MFKVSDFVESELKRMPEESYAPKDTNEVENKIAEYLKSQEEKPEAELPAVPEQTKGEAEAKAEKRAEPVQVGIPEIFLKKSGVVIREKSVLKRAAAWRISARL